MLSLVTMSRWPTNVSRSSAADLFCAHCQMPQKYGRCGTSRPILPLGFGKCQVSAAIAGASRLATAQALGGFQIRAAEPATKALLLDASSYEMVSRGK